MNLREKGGGRPQNPSQVVALKIQVQTPSSRCSTWIVFGVRISQVVYTSIETWTPPQVQVIAVVR